MKKFDFAIEKVFRFFEYNIINDNGKSLNLNIKAPIIKYQHNFECYVVQFAINKKILRNDTYYFNIVQNNKTIFKKKLFFIPNENRVIDEFSHEDPLIETSTDYLACLQIPPNYLSYFKEKVSIQFFDNENNIIIEEEFEDLFIKFGLNRKHDLYSEIKEHYILVSKKDCILRIHIGNEYSNYHEEEFFLKAHEEFSFKKYLLNNTYIGLQCSYESEPTELEEKYIMIGQKGITNSFTYFDGNEYFHSLLPFETKYQTLCTDKNLPENVYNQYTFVEKKKETWKEINNINDLYSHLENNLEKLNFFETTKEFIENQYKNTKTHGLGKVYNKNELKLKFHIDTEVCSHCKFNAKCMQLIPSGLSFSQLKKVIMYENSKECHIYGLIDSKENTNKL